MPGLASLLVLALAAPVAPTFGAPPGDTSSADDSYIETLALVGKVQAHNTARRYTEAARLAAEGAARSDLADDERVLLGALLFTPMALLVVSHYNGRKEMARINAATKEHPATEAETARAATLADRHTTTAGAVALGVTGAALTVAGWVLVLTSAPPARVAVTPWGGRGIGGLVLQGRF